MRMQTRCWRLAVLLVALAFALTACADGDGDTGTDADAGDTTTEDPTDADADTGDGEEDGGTAAGEFEEGSKMAEIQEAGVLRVGSKYDQPLFGVNTPSGVQGFDAEIAKLIAEGIFGDDFDPDRHIEWSEAVSAVREQVLQEDQVDIVAATYSINDDRKELVGFAGPYYIAGQDIMVEEGNPEDIQGVEDLNGLTVCSAEGSVSIEVLRERAAEAEIVALDTYSACAEELSQGRVQAVSTDNVILIGLIDERGEFELVGNAFTEEPYGIGVQKEAVDFRNWINDRLEEIYESGEWQEAWEQTVGTVIDEAPEPPQVERYED